MHKRISQFLLGSESDLGYARGGSCLSYVSNKENSLENLIIYGSSTPSSAPLGVLNEATGLYDIKVRLHGANLMGGEEFANIAIAKYGSKLSYTKTGDIFKYSISAPNQSTGITPEIPCIFKPNTVYTFRFHFKGTKNTSTGIRIAYTDGCSEDILAGTTDECDIAYTSVVGKSVSCIKFSPKGATNFTIDLSTFGIFEGEHGYDYFEPFWGDVYTLCTSTPYHGYEVKMGSIYDRFECKRKISSLHIMKQVIDESRLRYLDRMAVPMTVRIRLLSPPNINRPIIYFEGFTQYDTYDDIIGKVNAFCVPDETFIYYSGDENTNNVNYKEPFKQSKVILTSRKEKKYVIENTCVDMPNVERGYVGIEVYGGREPSHIIAYYKK